MITTKLKDALGRNITLGPAAYVDVGRGSISAVPTYIVGTKGKSVVCIYTRWLPKEDAEALIRDYLDGKLTAEEVKENTTTKVPTRIIMLNDSTT